MSTLLIRNSTVCTPHDEFGDGGVFARDGVIEVAGPVGDLPDAADEVVDVGGRIICPGFIDLQVNGGGGALLTEDATPEAVERMAQTYVRYGTTAIVPTVVTSGQEQMKRALSAVAEAMRTPGSGARVLGAHLEGPFISAKRRGAHAERFLQPPSVEAFQRLLEASESALRIITLAPELEGALELIGAARERGVVVSIGHTDATHEEARAGIDAGATMATHLFNGMRPLAHRDPGIVGAVLTDQRVIAGVIPDGVHVHPSILALIVEAKGPEYVAVVTDAMSVAGGEAAAFEIYGLRVEVRGGACYLPDGTLAGSALTMDRAVRNMHRFGSISLREAIQMATATPASVLSLDKELGVLASGARADIVVCDQDANVWRVYVGGKLAYAAE